MLKYKETEYLSDIVRDLSSEVLKLNAAVSKLEKHAASQVIRARDISLIISATLFSVSSVIWSVVNVGSLF